MQGMYASVSVLGYDGSEGHHSKSCFGFAELVTWSGIFLILDSCRKFHHELVGLYVGITLFNHIF